LVDEADEPTQVMLDNLAAAKDAARNGQRQVESRAEALAKAEQMRDAVASDRDAAVAKLAATTTEHAEAVAAAKALVTDWAGIWDHWRGVMSSEDQDESAELVDAEVARVNAEVDEWSAGLKAKRKEKP